MIMKTTTQKPGRFKKAAIALLFILFAGMTAQAQNVYMHSGTQTVPSNGSINFYDSGGPSSPDFWWEKWYSHNENATLTFKNGSAPIEIEFNKYTAYDGNTGANIGQYSLRVNNDHLYIYEGESADDTKLIVDLTGTVKDVFTVMTNGPMTIKFVSDASYREEGWAATVSSPSTYTVQSPLIVKETCSDVININNSALGATIYYTTDGNDPVVADPLTGATLYEGPFAINLDANNASVTVKAIAVVEGQANSAVASHTFTLADQRPTPGVPTITIEGNTVTMTPDDVPAGLNDTYKVRYTTNGDDPTANNGTVYTGPFEWTTPNTVFKAITQATECPDKISAVVSASFGNVTVPTPTISFNANGTATISCSLTGATIYYTIDGSTPTTSSSSGTTTVTTAALTPGTTVHAYAVYSETGYDDSAMASEIYVPAGGSTVSGGVVLLDDREPHTWSYYTEDSPIHSLNPRDIKITYYGNSPAGRTTMTNASENGDTPTSFSATATGVAVNVNEPGDQFIYLKTLEAANADGSGNYPYTAIPNPFQVRPLGESTTGTVTVTETAHVVSGGTGTNYYSPMYTSYADYGFKSEYIIPASYFTSAGISNGDKLKSITLYQSSTANWTATSLTIKLLNSNTSNYSSAAFVGDGGTTVYTNSSYSSGAQTSHTFDFSTPFVYTGGNLVVQISSGHNGTYAASSWYGISTTSGNRQSCYGYYSSNSATSYSNVTRQRFLPNTTFTVEKESTGTIPGYHGFYAWRVKSLSSGLTIQRANGTSVGVNGIIDAEEEIKFVTSNEEGNEVEFEALWAQAYVAECSTANGLSDAIASSQLHDNVGYERNFVVVTGGTQTSDISNTSQKPVTITQLYPDGSGTMNSSRYLAGYFTANKNTKFENVYIRDGAASTSGYQYTYYLCIVVGNNNYYFYTGNGWGSYYNAQTYSLTVPADNDPYSDWETSLYATGQTATYNGNQYTVYYYFTNRTTTTLTNASAIYNANGKDLVFGRGVMGYNDGVCVNSVRGLSNNSSTSYNLRIESGIYNNLLFMGSYGLTSGKLTSILGSDYDRAKKENSKLIIDNYITMSETQESVGSASSLGEEIFRCTVKSGTFDLGNYGANGSAFYVSAGMASSMYGKRTFIVEGGVFGDISGGFEANGASIGDKLMMEMRIKGGQFNSIIYGAAMRAAAGGHRRMVFTGGEIKGWIAGGCNGTDLEVGGKTYGNTYIYFGGNAKCDSNGDNTTIGQGQATGGNIFGAGSGHHESDETSTVGEVDNSTVVIADNAVVEHSVYGGGNYGYVAEGTGHKSDIVVLGGTVKESVFGGSNMQKGQIVNIIMKNGTVQGNIYGGSNTRGTISGLATIEVSGGTVTNVFGGGYGASTDMAGGTDVTVKGGTINNNVYGGGQLGSVTGNTVVTIEGGTMKDVYGAGLGTEYSGNWPPSAANANVTGTTTVNVSGGTIANVYGGGENGSVAYSSTAASATGKSTVTISGGEVSGDVFGGGKNGTTQGATIANVSGGNIRGNVFGGAYGDQNKVYVTGQRTVNMTGGHVYGNVYGGSRNANDGKALDLAANSFSGSTEEGTISVTNISGGIIDQNVYAAGYYGNTFGSVYAFIGKNAIENAPNKSTTEGVTYSVKTLIISGTVWAGGDWGTFNGTFGDPTISGNSNIYVDGLDYETETNQTSNAQYMNIGGSILGAGTSCHAGKKDRIIIVRNYGHADGNQPTEATRTLFSIQFAKVLIFDNTNLNFTGQGRINELNTTETYAIYEIANGAVTDEDPYGVRLMNGSGLFLNAPVNQIANFKSMSCDDVYTDDIDDDYTVVMPSTLSATPNKIRVNGGNYIDVRYGSQYGALIGYAYMMASTDNSDGTCAYARPKNCTTTPIATNLDNPDDGGWVSYNSEENTFALDGTSGNIQMPYENHTVRNGEDYFRIWRIGSKNHYREGVFDAVADGSDTFSTVDVIINLPAFRDPNNYYRFERTDDHQNYTISYGADVLTFNAARESDNGTITNDWMSVSGTTQTTGQAQTAVSTGVDQIKQNPNVNFGLVGMPSTGMSGSNYIICPAAEDLLIADGSIFPKSDNTKEPEFVFRLTYYNKLTSNMTWDPMTIVLVQCDSLGNVVDHVTISLAVTTSASIEQEFTTQLYAIMQGKGSTSDTYDAKVVLPTYNVYHAGQESKFKVNSVNFTPRNSGNLIERAGTYTYTDYAVTYAAGYNYDNTNGWETGTFTHRDAYPLTQNNPTAVNLGETGGRSEFAIDFRLHYNGLLSATQSDTIGILKFNITFDNYKKQTGVDPDTGEPIYTLVNNQPLTIIVQVIRRGQGSKFYLDGINGDNANDARHPDKAVTSLSTIFNRCGYLAGDEIYIVNQINTPKKLEWNGLPYSNVTIYRYDGGHELSAADAQITDNENNAAYTGILLNVTNNMSITGITLDGHYNNGENTIVVGYDQNNQPVTAPFTSVTATAPMINIASGGKVELGTGTVLQQNNNNTSNGGAVCVNNGGTLMMNDDAQIINNVVSSTMNGGGVYMDGTMIVSDNVKVINNKQATIDNNVNLTSADQVIQIGTDLSTDDYDALGDEAEIGVTKQLYANYSGYTRVVYVETQTAWLETPYQSDPNAIIFHDGHKYDLVKFTPENYLYWIGTWVSVQDHVPTTEEGGWPYTASSTEFQINTEYQLAWIISMVNGENGCTADDFSGKTIYINDNIDMDESIWVPIGTTRKPFKGTLEGNGHAIFNMRSPLEQTNLAMFAITENATIKDMITMVNFDANATNMASVVANMNGTTVVSNVEAAGTMKGGANTQVMGGVAANVASGATIHSCIGVATIEGGASTENIGGIVGINGGNLFNSYSNCSITGGTNKGGLAGTNNGTIENCYTILGDNTFPAFAVNNAGTIQFCYADKDSYVQDNTGGTMTGHGTYDPVKGRKELGYMYGDNKVNATNNYVVSAISYANNRIDKWPGLLSTLNQWVKANPAHLTDPTPWLRPTSGDINGDLPVLCFPKDNCLATTDGRFLQYSSNVGSNGLDLMLGVYSGQKANIFLYGVATEVENVPGTNVNVFINEDAVLLQKQGSKAGDFINTTVGVTFDNSYKNASDFFGNTLSYDWHLMSTPLSNASMGITYDESIDNNWWEEEDQGQVTGVSGSYMPDNINAQTDVKWDLYTYYEPKYHWMNYKRNSASHYQYDEPHDNIPYTNDDIFVPGKGYMMAISQDSYLNNTGTLNNGKVDIDLTCSGTLPETNDPTKDWGSNLIGNPYQAYLNLDKVAENTGYNKFYIYSAESNQYVPYTNGSSKNTWTPSQYIHPHQAFFVLKDDASASETFTFTYDMATATKDDESYFRKGDHIDYPLINLFVNNETGARNYTIIEVGRPELGGAEKTEALRTTDFDLYSHYGQDDYKLLFTPAEAQRVAVFFNTKTDGTYNLTWDTQNGEFSFLRLIDNITGVEVDMLNNDHYTFEGHATDYASRFYILFNNPNEEPGGNGNGNGNGDNFAYYDGYGWIINGEGILQLVDVTGRILYREYLAGDMNRIHLDNIKAGVYVLQLGDKTQKIVIR